ncbi:MAG: class I SAM-dependent methyltransferase [Rubrivivax sp.]|nr:class I SAM-dependent methyltransferase [Rubrivivax sp.]
MNLKPLPGRALALPWPLPALLAWAAGWAVWRALLAAGLAPLPALAAAGTVAGLLALGCRGRWRRVIAFAGFPLSVLAWGGSGGLAPWAWLVALAPLLALYPVRAWRDAPLFPTPADALQGLDAIVGQPARVLDAGCGLGHGLAALRRLWPTADVAGVEWSPLLAWASALRLPGAKVRRGDMWAMPWSGHDLVYLFQRPESMARAYDKAARELAPGAWLVSLEFAVPGRRPHASLQGPGRKPVWVYRPADPDSTAARRRR